MNWGDFPMVTRGSWIFEDSQHFPPHETSTVYLMRLVWCQDGWKNKPTLRNPGRLSQITRLQALSTQGIISENTPAECNRRFNQRIGIIYNCTLFKHHQICLSNGPIKSANHSNLPTFIPSQQKKDSDHFSTSTHPHLVLNHHPPRFFTHHSIIIIGAKWPEEAEGKNKLGHNVRTPKVTISMWPSGAHCYIHTHGVPKRLGRNWDGRENLGLY